MSCSANFAHWVWHIAPLENSGPLQPQREDGIRPRGWGSVKSAHSGQGRRIRFQGRVTVEPPDESLADPGSRRGRGIS